MSKLVWPNHDIIAELSYVTKTFLGDENDMEISTTYLSMVYTTENSFKIFYEINIKAKVFITIFIK